MLSAVITIREGAEFPEAARATAVLAISKGDASFTYGDKTYSLVKEGGEFYTFGDALLIAKTRTLAGKFSVDAAPDTGFVAVGVVLGQAAHAQHAVEFA